MEIGNPVPMIYRRFRNISGYFLSEQNRCHDYRKSLCYPLATSNSQRVVTESKVPVNKIRDQNDISEPNWCCSQFRLEIEETWTLTTRPM